MRAVVQRVLNACVGIEEKTVSSIGRGLLVLLGVEKGDTQEDLAFMVQKIANLRVFDDQDGKMNLSVQDVGGAVMVVSQFTLLGDARKGRRPSYIDAAEPDVAEQTYQNAIEMLRANGIPVEQGRFMANMQVSLCNDGPVTLILDSRKRI